MILAVFGLRILVLGVLAVGVWILDYIAYLYFPTSLMFSDRERLSKIVPYQFLP